MLKRKPLIAAIVVVVGAVGWYAFRPEKLFVNEAVNEEFPAASASASNAPQAIYSGSFHGVAHETRGTATIYRLPDGKRVLRFTNFATSNGPDVNVYLAAAADANDNETVTNAGFVSLGSIKGNVGDQNYDLPADVDLNKYRSVVIWCKRFGVNFGAAPLQAQQSKPVILSEGSFHGVAHETNGTAAVYRLPDGKRVLRFTNFATSNGPDVNVYLVAAADANDNETVTTAGFVSLGPIKGNVGDQNYDLPVDLDLNKYRSVVIWCKRFGVNFGAAPLTATMAAKAF
jgi:hypothetical protein